MNQAKAILAILLIFGSGIGTGYLLKPGANEPVAPPDEGSRNSSKKPLAAKRSIGPVFFRSLGHLNNHLELTPEQQRQIGRIMDASRERIADKGADFREVLEGEHAAWREAVRAELTPEQKKIFDSISNFRFRKEPGRPDGHKDGRPKSSRGPGMSGGGSV